MSALPAAIEAMFAERDIPVVSAEADLRALQLEPPRRFAHGELACDLRLDPRAARNRLASRVLPWRWPLLAGLLAVGFWTATQIMAIDALREETAQVRAATLQVVREAFVPDGPILDVRTQVSRALAEARVAASGQGDRVAVLDLMGLISDVLMAEGANPVLLDYSADEAIRVVAQVADFAAAETLAGALREAGLEVRVVESRAEESNDGVSTELEISARDAAQSEERP
jgi:general secretion pathway protein L